jgi:hypothetical protein
MGVPKSPRLGVSQLCGIITSCVDLRSGWGLNWSFSPHREFSNIVSHATCTQRNRVDSWLSVVESQTTSLTSDLSFGHNLCCKCRNGSCEPILDIYVSITFQWYKKLHKARGFDPCNHLKFWKSTRTPILNNKSSFGSVSVHSHTLPHSRASFLAQALASPCLGRELKTRVATFCILTTSLSSGWWPMTSLLELSSLGAYTLGVWIQGYSPTWYYTIERKYLVTKTPHYLWRFFKSQVRLWP